MGRNIDRCIILLFLNQFFYFTVYYNFSASLYVFVNCFVVFTIKHNFTSKIDYRSSMVDTSITDLRRSTHRSLVFEGQHIHLRRSTHRSSKVDRSISEGRHIVTSIFEGRHIDIRKLPHRSSKVNSKHIDLRKSTLRSSKMEGGNITPIQFVVEYCPQLRS